MTKTTLYHGSKEIVLQPEFGRGKSYNDYGQGFYCTQSQEMAKEWACGSLEDGFANCYELETAGLEILDLNGDEYHILNWLALLMQNRQVKVASPIAKQGIEYLGQQFCPDVSGYDVIAGYRADDSYFAFARAFVNNTISLTQLGKAMQLGRLGQQMMIKSPRGFEQLKFCSYQPVEGRVYHLKRNVRDERARSDYQAMLTTDDLDGLFMRDLIREKVTNDDPRLR
jgi:hypothetical protein